MIEVETKYHVENHQDILEKLKLLDFEILKKTHQLDRIYLQRTKDFIDFKPGDPVIRIRVEDNKSKLTFKRAINKDGDSIEHEISINPPEIAHQMILEIGFHLVTEVEKKRSEYKLDDVHVVLDDVVGLGRFVEVEIVCKEGHQKDARIKVSKIANSLGLKKVNIEPKKYDELISLRQKTK